MAKDSMKTSSWGRMTQLGGLAGRVGASILSEKVREIGSSEEERESRKTENLVLNATRLVKTLGELKGAAMKVGQMLSLHVGILPPEVAAVLNELQRSAPSVPFEVMEGEVRGQLPDYDEIFEHLEPRAFAAASIGQVHRGILRDGRRVAVKIQYPEIERILRADLKNLRLVLERLLAMFATVEFEPIWEEVRDRLLEELDYEHEAANMRTMAELYADMPEILVPEIVGEASTRRVLTMEALEGIPPEIACSERYPQKLKDRWGRVLFEFLLRGIVEHGVLHADPNFSNFAFFDDGRVIVYDFGCVKRLPEELSAGYATLFSAALDHRKEEIPKILHDMGVYLGDGEPLPADMIDSYHDLFNEILREEPPYTFGEDEEFYQKIFALGTAHMSDARDIRFPQDVIFLDRTLAGHFGNLTKLRATGPWRALARRYVDPAP